MFGGVLLPLVVAGFFSRPGTERERALRYVTWIGLAVLMAWTINIRVYRETHLALLPAFSVLGAALLHRLLASQRRPIAIACWSIVALLTLSPVAARRISASMPGVPSLPFALAEARDRLPKGVVLVTDAPSQVAWYADRVAIPLPRGDRNLGEMIRLAGDRPVGYFLSFSLLTPGPQRELKTYQDMLIGKTAPEGFVEVELQTAAGRLLVPAALADQIAPPPSPPASG
jgi:hypothetical protein